MLADLEDTNEATNEATNTAEGLQGFDGADGADGADSGAQLSEESRAQLVADHAVNPLRVSAS